MENWLNVCVCVRFQVSSMILVHNSYKTNTHPRLLTNVSVCFCIKRNQDAHIAAFTMYYINVIYVWICVLFFIHIEMRVICGSYSYYFLSLKALNVNRWLATETKRACMRERGWCIEWAKHYYDNFLSWIAMDMFTLCLKQIIPINI